MPLFRKKPVVIEAVQFDGTSTGHDTIEAFVGQELGSSRTSEQRCVIIPTLEGDHLASPGDWIIKGIAGEFYPCKPSIFAATYEPAGPPIPKELRQDAERYQQLRKAYTICDFAYAGCNGEVALIFAFPPNTRVSADLDATLDRAARLASDSDTQEGAHD